LDPKCRELTRSLFAQSRRGNLLFGSVRAVFCIADCTKPKLTVSDCGGREAGS
jgi:hypothetical protein